MECRRSRHNFRQGRLDEVVDFLVDVIRNSPDIQGIQATVALVHAGLGHLDEARALLAPLSATGIGIIPRDDTRLNSLGGYAVAAAATGETELCRLLRDELLPHATEIISTSGIEVRGAGAHDVALLDQALSDLDQADEHFAQALEILERIEAPYFIAMTQVAWAEMLIQRDEPGDAGHARDLATQAHVIVDHYHFPAVGTGHCTPVKRRPSLAPPESWTRGV